MNIILFDPESIASFHPLTLTKPLAEVTFGALTLKEKWSSLWANAQVSSLSEDYIKAKFPVSFAQENLYIDTRLIPSAAVIETLKKEKQLVEHGKLMAFTDNRELKLNQVHEIQISDLEINTNCHCEKLNHLTDLFSKAELGIKQDLDILLNSGKLKRYQGEFATRGVKVLGDNLFVAPGVELTACTLNTESGPVILLENAKIMEGSVIRGALVLGEGATLKMSAKVYGPTYIGKYCKVGGEVSNSVIQPYSNKGHDGFLGNSVIGEWCNLGADTNTSNLKNNYGLVSLFNYQTQQIEKTELQFVGTLMGDHSKTGINTMLNTGTVIGPFANVFDAGFPPKYIPSFSWGGQKGFELFKYEKAIEVAERMMSRRSVSLTEADKHVFHHLYTNSQLNK